MRKVEEKNEEITIDLQPLPEGWTWSNLGAIGLARLGKTPAKAAYRDSGEHKIVKFRDVYEDGQVDWGNVNKGYVDSSPEVLRALKELREGDVLVTASAHMSEHIGKKVGIVRNIPSKYKAAYVVGEILQIRTKEEIDPRWVLYYLRSTQGYKAIQRRVHGVHLIASRAQSIEIPIAPFKQQKRIVEEIEKQFSRLDEAVANLKRVKANLKRYKAAVLKAAVEGRLVETEAELARREGHSYETGAQLLQRILETRRSQWKSKGKYKEPAAPDTTDLPELPEGWVWSLIGQSFDVYVGATPSRAKLNYWGGGIPWVSSGEVAFCRIKSTRETISAEGFENSSTNLHPAGTVLLGMIGEGKTRGQPAILDIEACNNQNSAAIRVSETDVLPEYVYLFLEKEYEDTRRRGSGGNQPALNKERVRQIPIPLPPVNEQCRITSEVERLLSLVRALGLQVDADIRRTARFRQSILKEAFIDNKLSITGDQA